MSKKKSKKPVLQRISGAAASADAGFMRAEIYSVKAAMGVIGEAGRLEPRYFQHLTEQGLEAKEPIVLDGLAPDRLRSWLKNHTEAASKATVSVAETIDKNGKFKAAHMRAQPSNTATVMGVVCGYSGPPDNVDERYLRWKELVKKWAKRRWGDHVVAIYEHTDESRGHVHVLVAKKDAKNIRDLHPGCARQDQHFADAVKLLPPGMTYRDKEKHCKAGSQKAYEEGNKALQDDYFSNVSNPVGMKRCADKSWMRYSFQEALLRKRLNEEIADQISALEKREKDALERENRVLALEEMLGKQAKSQAHKNTMLLALESGIKRDQHTVKMELEILEKDKTDAIKLRGEIHAQLERLTRQLNAVKSIFLGLDSAYKNNIFGLSELVKSGVLSASQAQEVGSMLQKEQARNEAAVKPLRSALHGS